MIDKFDGQYAFLSNFYPSPIYYCYVHYETVEAAYQSMKTTDIAQRHRIAIMGPGEAKRAGRKIILRKDWENVKLNIMSDLVRCKFIQNSELACKLIKTGDEYLQEGNYWHDTYWGVCNGVGENHLGIILMNTRNELRANKALLISLGLEGMYI